LSTANRAGGWRRGGLQHNSRTRGRRGTGGRRRRGRLRRSSGARCDKTRERALVATSERIKPSAT
jgi:hypothetical protein